MTKHQDGTTPKQHHHMLGEGGGLSLCFSLSVSGEDRPESDSLSSNIHVVRAQQAQMQCG
jgi:hypothetical protein